MDPLSVVFTVGDAVCAGYSDWQIEHKRRTGAWVALRRGVFCAAPTLRQAADDPRMLHGLHAQARVRGLNRRAWISHCSAGYVYGLVLPFGQPARVTLTADSGSVRSSADLEIQVGAVPAEHQDVVAGIAVTSAARTVVDLARHLRHSDAVAAGDSAMRLGLTDHAEVLAVLDACTSWPGVIAARNAVARMDGRRESWLESRSGLMFDEYGLPRPEAQVWIASGQDAPFARVDFLWNPPGVIGEADGAVKYAAGNPAALLDEKRRQERLESLGFIVVRWDIHDVTRQAWRTAQRIQGALDRAWLARSAGVPLLATCIPSQPSRSLRTLAGRNCQS